ncbi:MAG: MoxR family ATPase [Bacteroidota bacterium]
MAKTLIYKGEKLKSKQSFTDRKGEQHKLDVYLPSEELKMAVNLAFNLKRPLLLMGEPGCGKTRLAEAVAYELHGDKMYDHFFRWDIKSTTKAKDGIYQYDALRRLRDVNAEIDIDDISKYIADGELVKALKQTPNGDKPNILLIDEIDKADIDFPNDLLLELDKSIVRYSVEGQAFDIKPSSDIKPIIFVTSNQEKELPPALLRRCLYQYIHFPEKEQLEEIVSKYVESVDDKLIDKAIDIFLEIRSSLDENDKKPSTSELIDWFQMISFYSGLKGKGSKLSKEEKQLVEQLDAIDIEKVPFRQVLLKTYASSEQYNVEND